MSEVDFNEAENYEKDSSNQREDGHKIIDFLSPKKFLIMAVELVTFPSSWLTWLDLMGR